MDSSSPLSPVESPWSRSVSEILEVLGVDSERGLTGEEAENQLRKHGENALTETQSRTVFGILIDQFESLIVLLLIVAAAVAFLFGEWIEGFAIAAVILINALIGFFTEWRAVRSMEALRQLGGVSARVRRDGEIREIPAEKLVPGDIVILEGGDLITADVRLTQASKLQADESALTGESVPVEKSVEPTRPDAPLAERTSMVYKGTALTRGSGEGIVVGTGMTTELGEITSLVDQAVEQQTPLEERLDQLGNRLIWLTLIIALFVSISGILAGKGLFLMIETGIALAVATVPEGLPIVATMALARGMLRMAKRNALINRLSAVETLGATTIIFTDKTGTLTENKMTVRELRVPSGTVMFSDGAPPEKGDGGVLDGPELEGIRQVMTPGILCNNSSLSEDEDGRASGVGDPMEVALLEAGERLELRRRELIERMPEVREEAFDSETKMMATYHETDDGLLVAVKGAPEAVLKRARRIRVDGSEQPLDDDQRRQWLEQNETMAKNGQRVLALAQKTGGAPDDEPYTDLTFLGLVGLLDPPRRDVQGAIRRCHEAGIRVIMVTGDQAETARNIAHEVGLIDRPDVPVVTGSELSAPGSLGEEERKRLLEVPIFSRVSPAQKLRLIELHQQSGGVAGMTGDGVNDAPALKKADIGIAMGQRGTQVAREAADMVLTDDAFSSIVAAIEQGRVIFENIRKFVFYLLSCNVSEILVVGLASIAQIPLPILPLQILYLNLVTDVFPALALGMGEGEEGVMKHPPRDPQEPILIASHWISIGLYGVVFTVAVLGALSIALYGLGYETPRAVSVSFLTLALAQLFHVFNLRDYGSGILVNDITTNPWVWGALLLCVGLLFIVVYVPVLSTVLRVVDPGLNGWALILGMSLVPLVYGQIVKTWEWHLFSRSNDGQTSEDKEQ